MSLVSQYRDIPVSCRVGNGAYTYTCVLDSDKEGISKCEIFANNVEVALSMVEHQQGLILNWHYINPDVISINLARCPTATCLLYING